MKIVFCFSQFSPNNLQLQPWLTVHRVAVEMIKKGHEVHVITESCNRSLIDNIIIYSINSLRGTNSKKIEDLLVSIKPDCVIVSVTPLSLATSSWYKCLIKFKSYAFASYPFYKINEIIRAVPHQTMRERMEIGRQIMVPKYVWKNKLEKYFAGIICQSERTKHSVNKLCRPKLSVYSIPPGIDLEIWESGEVSAKSRSTNTFLYAGRTSKMRGFNIILDAFSKINKPEIELRILARGASQVELAYIDKSLKVRNLHDRATIKSGWLGHDELRTEIQSCRAVLLPFVLVPAELPVTVMESICCGTPVVVSDIDGLPEAAGEAGIVIPPADVNYLARVIERLHTDEKLIENLKYRCKRQKEKMLSWDKISEKWQEAVFN